MSDTQYTSGTGGVPPTGASGGTSTMGTSSGSSSTSSTADDARRAASGVVEGAKERAGDVAHEAGERAKSLVDQARSEVTNQASSQQGRLADGLRHLSTELGDMSRSTEDPGYASELAQRGSDAVNRVADWFEQREPGDVMREVQDFARCKPGTFLAIAAGAGLVVGRLLRGARDADSGNDSGASASQGAQYSGAQYQGTHSQGTQSQGTGYGAQTELPASGGTMGTTTTGTQSTGVLPSTGYPSTTGGGGNVAGA